MDFDFSAFCDTCNEVTRHVSDYAVADAVVVKCVVCGRRSYSEKEED